MRFNLSNIPAKLSKRLLRQNPGRIKVSSHWIRAGVIGQEQTVQFRILEGEKPAYDLPGIPYRVSAGIPDPGATLFVIPVGHFDYRIVRSKLGEDSAISTLCHDPFLSGNNTALTVAGETQQTIRGIGRAMTSIALNHIASEGIRTLTLHDVLDPRFFRQYSRKARIVDRYSIDEDGPETITMELAARPQKEIARIILSARAEPIERILESLSTQPRRT